MEPSSDLKDVFEDRRKSISLFQSFWDRRIKVESDYIGGLEKLVFDVPGPTGSLKDALDALNALLRIEIDQRTVILSRLRDLRKDSPAPSGGWRNPLEDHWFISKNGAFEKKISNLATQKSSLASEERVAEKATQSTEKATQSTEPEIKSSSVPRLFFVKRKQQSSANKLNTLVKVPPSFTQFNEHDQACRKLVGRHNDTREFSIGESMQKADELMTKLSEHIALIQKMISAFADSQSDFASALNKGVTQCRFMANKISPSTESHNSLTRIQDSISVAFGEPYVYKNYWFGVGVHQRSPTLLFGYIPQQDSNSTTLEYMIRAFKALVKYDPLLSLDPSINSRDGRYEQLSKLAYDFETCWDPEEVDGGGEVVRLLTTDPRTHGLALHFLWRAPRSLAARPNLVPATISDIFRSFCEKCNSRSYSERKMLSVVIHLLVDFSMDEKGVQWMWWDQYDRKKCWYRALTRYDEGRMMTDLLPLWIHCIDPKAEEFVFHREKLESLYESWKKSVESQVISPNIPPM